MKQLHGFLIKFKLTSLFMYCNDAVKLWKRDGIQFQLLIILMSRPTQGQKLRSKINYHKTRPKLKQLKMTITFNSPIVSNRNRGYGKWLSWYYYSNKICIIKTAFQLVFFYFPCRNHFICRTCSGALASKRSKSSALLPNGPNVVSWFAKHFMGFR